jgi:hypothetical protein
VLLEGKQVRQARQRAAVFQEVVHKQLVCRRTALDVDTQTHRQESLELLAQLVGLLEAGRSVGGNQVQRLQGLLVQVGGLRLDHFNSHDTQRPDVDLGAVLLLLDDFGSHPVGRADHGGTLRLGLSELGTEAEISNLDVSTAVEKNVVTLDITVDDALCMEMLQTTASLS